MSRLLIAALAVLLAGCTTVEPGSPRTTVTPVAGERPSDRDLQGRWWTWAASSPEERNPVVDPTGQFCGEDQPADVWFFAGTFGGDADRTCEVPAGRPLAGPAINGTGPGCAGLLADATGSVTLDGQVVELRRVEPVAITIQAARGNVMGLRTGRTSTSGCGLWAWIPPLTPGVHELRIEGASGDFSTSARYRLTVGGGD